MWKTWILVQFTYIGKSDTGKAWFKVCYDYFNFLMKYKLYLFEKTEMYLVAFDIK